MKIYVPSRGRARTSLQYTINDMPMALREITTLVVRPEEFDDYRNVASLLGVGLLRRPETCENLSQTLDWLVHDDFGENDPHIVMADDDIRFSYRRDPSKYNQPRATPDEVGKIFDRIKRLLDLGYPLVGITARMGCNGHFPSTVRYGIRQMQLHAVSRPFFAKHNIHYSDVGTKSDFHTTLKVLEAGAFNAVITNASVDQAKGSNAPGGVSSYRTIEVMNDGAQRLKELHPETVKIVKKTTEWKGLGNVERDEVKIDWKRAQISAKHPA